MRIVIDSNVIIAMLIRPGIPIDTFFNENLEIYAPYLLLDEIESHRDIILKKSFLERDDLMGLRTIIISKIRFISETEFKEQYYQAESICPDRKDVPFFALALSLN